MPPPQQIDLEKFKSLELRLMGCMRTIKNLERENQAKSDRISSLALELDKKSKTIETLLAEKVTWDKTAGRVQASQNISANHKKREKELETKIKEQEVVIGDQKR